MSSYNKRILIQKGILIGSSWVTGPPFEQIDLSREMKYCDWPGLNHMPILIATTWGVSLLAALSELWNYGVGVENSIDEALVPKKGVILGRQKQQTSLPSMQAPEKSYYLSGG